MEEPEVPTEHLHEAIHHHAEHSRELWVLGRCSKFGSAGRVGGSFFVDGGTSRQRGDDGADRIVRPMELLSVQGHQRNCAD